MSPDQFAPGRSEAVPTPMYPQKKGMILQFNNGGIINTFEGYESSCIIISNLSSVLCLCLGQ